MELLSEYTITIPALIFLNDTFDALGEAERLVYIVLQSVCLVLSIYKACMFRNISSFNWKNWEQITY